LISNPFLQHPFLQKAKNTSLLAHLVDETMEGIAAAGGREAALGLDDEVPALILNFPSRESSL
jgi:hypothetical protein